ncbi:hypothetical protein TREMEDRAFT_60171 [Tremella mesenterica DSM 1558]|uniref:uncharacterized protein n=1 Tax=Tremella mesenterica (strain ATCC 24925 / CBS 8224 / DSM 1558 / NBRC 9311 / NRRL Y-6157 / RJB 2259-6 / UBC 559-6) TaxID=578456 RepID=UPI0003F49972|nr:uncharacterized protein TREMEDRAFT_60171 [Tremella mesenterica DSM 1558]EIW71236.1 hypothetical protein TREMEDRAFT_60171 [Tremella mesenterica DSM 1558]
MSWRLVRIRDKVPVSDVGGTMEASNSLRMTQRPADTQLLTEGSFQYNSFILLGIWGSPETLEPQRAAIAAPFRVAPDTSMMSSLKSSRVNDRTKTDYTKVTFRETTTLDSELYALEPLSVSLYKRYCHRRQIRLFGLKS